MSIKRRILFAAFTVLLVAVLIEGGARLYWNYRENIALGQTRAAGAAVLQNDAINFMKQADGVYGYILRPSLVQKVEGQPPRVWTNAAGFAQIDDVDVDRAPGELRILALGESTTQGHDTREGNYPIHLKNLIETHGRGFDRVTMINAGVSGWVSDQLALYAERRLVDYDPDIVLLYAGWNDFNWYDPLVPPPKESIFARRFGASEQLETYPLRSIALAAHLFAAVQRNLETTISEEKAGTADKQIAVRKSENLLLSATDLRQSPWYAARSSVSAANDHDLEQGFIIQEDQSAENTHTVHQAIDFDAHRPYSVGALVKPDPDSPSPRNVALAVDSHGRTVNIFVEFDLERRAVSSTYGAVDRYGIHEVEDGWFRIWATWIAPATESADIVIALSSPDDDRIYTGDGESSLLVRAPQVFETAEVNFVATRLTPDVAPKTYTFLLQNLDRIVSAFRRTNPDVKIAISTLVGRWDEMSESEYNGPAMTKLRWMSAHDVSRIDAAESLSVYNDLLRDYAVSRNLLLIDAAKHFDGVDRKAIFDPPGTFGDFAHMFGDGYRTLARTFYDGLRNAGYIDGDAAPSPGISENTGLKSAIGQRP